MPGKGKLTGGAKERDRRRRAILKRDGDRCYYCGCTVVEVPPGGEPFRDLPPDGARWATIEHLLPLGTPGRNRIENLVIACHVCNNERSKETDPLNRVPRPKLR